MKRDVAFLALFLIVICSKLKIELDAGFPVADAVAYAIGFGVLWFTITFAAFGLVWLVFHRRLPTNRNLFGGSNEQRQTRV